MTDNKRDNDREPLRDHARANRQRGTICQGTAAIDSAVTPGVFVHKCTAVYTPADRQARINSCSCHGFK